MKLSWEVAQAWLGQAVQWIRAVVHKHHTVDSIQPGSDRSFNEVWRCALLRTCYKTWWSLYNSVNSYLTLLFYEVDRLIPLNCGAISLVFKSFSVSFLNPLQIFNMLLEMLVIEVVMVWNIILVSSTYRATRISLLLLFPHPCILPKSHYFHTVRASALNSLSQLFAHLGS